MSSSFEQCARPPTHGCSLSAGAGSRDRRLATNRERSPVLTYPSVTQQTADAHDNAHARVLVPAVTRSSKQTRTRTQRRSQPCSKELKFSASFSGGAVTLSLSLRSSRKDKDFSAASAFVCFRTRERKDSVPSLHNGLFALVAVAVAVAAVVVVVVVSINVIPTYRWWWRRLCVCCKNNISSWSSISSSSGRRG